MSALDRDLGQRIAALPRRDRRVSDAYHCRFCGQAEVVPSLVAEHERECVARGD